LKFYLLIDIFAQKEQIISKEDLSSLDKTKDEIKSYNTKISNLKDFYSNQIYYGEMIEAILKINIPKGVEIIYISSEKSGSNIKTTIYGFSDLRENLILFKNNIENDSIIKNPYFPPESWTKISNINFYLTFEYENQK
jgi:hypothetical protein